jgi:hypothetical protein
MMVAFTNITQKFFDIFFTKNVFVERGFVCYCSNIIRHHYLIQKVIKSFATRIRRQTKENQDMVNA